LHGFLPGIVDGYSPVGKRLLIVTHAGWFVNGRLWDEPLARQHELLSAG